MVKLLIGAAIGVVMTLVVELVFFWLLVLYKPKKK